MFTKSQLDFFANRCYNSGKEKGGNTMRVRLFVFLAVLCSISYAYILFDIGMQKGIEKSTATTATYKDGIFYLKDGTRLEVFDDKNTWVLTVEDGEKIAAR